VNICPPWACYNSMFVPASSGRVYEYQYGQTL
jgi:hypothetical protein